MFQTPFHPYPGSRRKTHHMAQSLRAQGDQFFNIQDIRLGGTQLQLSAQQPFSAYRFTGNTFDCGSKEGFIKANVSFALLRDDMRGKVEDDIRRMIADLDR